VLYGQFKVNPQLYAMGFNWWGIHLLIKYAPGVGTSLPMRGEGGESPCTPCLTYARIGYGVVDWKVHDLQYVAVKCNVAV
jgi:hypothetical protein